METSTAGSVFISLQAPLYSLNVQFLCAKTQKEIEVTTVTPNRLRGILANLNLNQILIDSTLHLHTYVLLMYVTTEVAMYVAADAVFSRRKRRLKLQSAMSSVKYAVLCLETHAFHRQITLPSCATRSGHLRCPRTCRASSGEKSCNFSTFVRGTFLCYADVCHSRTGHYYNSISSQELQTVFIGGS